MKWLPLLSMLLCIVGIAHGESVGCAPPPGVQTSVFDRNSVATPDVRATWVPGQFTDPAHHDAHHFRYFVHMIDMMGAGRSPRSVYNFLTQNFAKNPCATLSTSVIDQDHQATFGNAGFIFKVPAENILLARSTDIASQNLDSNTDVDKFNSTLNFSASWVGPVPTLEKLISDTLVNGHNEILVEGKATESIQIIGVIMNPIIAFGLGPQRNAPIKEMLDIAAENNWPVVYYGR